MPALVLLVVIGVVIIWFAASSFFPAIGKFARSLWGNAIGDDDKNEEEKEKKNEQ